MCIFAHEETKTSNFCFCDDCISQESHYKDPCICFSETLLLDYYLRIVPQTVNRKFAYLKTSSETKTSVKWSLIKIWIILILFDGSNTWCSSETIFRQKEELQRNSLKWTQSSFHFTDKNYRDCLNITFIILSLWTSSYYIKFWEENFHFKESNFGKCEIDIPTSKFFYLKECICQRCRCRWQLILFIIIRFEVHPKVKKKRDQRISIWFD